ncbi:MAG: 4a-hydroxytetrahydrobiopterin dehydratase [Nitrospirota bacterium]|nr:4a-hydroxytetrahydrobiopterin dehydratase [Nitrospirota bacterium]
MISLAEKKCVPCSGGVPALNAQTVGMLLQELGGGWRVLAGHRLEKTYTFPDFKSALAFVNRIGALAEAEGHHPDIYLTWGKVVLTVWTHAVDGLTESDFILAAKADHQV